MGVSSFLDTRCVTVKCMSSVLDSSHPRSSWFDVDYLTPRIIEYILYDFNIIERLPCL